jgi:ubiquinone/menaquinone biosynthesis C-methylase UbiE
MTAAVDLQSKRDARRPLPAQGEALKGRVQDHWESETCGIRYGKAANRSAWLRQIAQTRYELEPYIPDFARFEEAAGKSILEIGTGAGCDFVQWCRHAHHATGIDLTAAAIALTRERLQLDRIPTTRYELQVADAEALPFADNTFDVVYSWGVLHHTPSTDGAFAEVWRVLRPGGTMRVMVYHVPSWTGLLLYLLHGPARGHPLLGLKGAIYRHLESPGTKSYTRAEGRRLVEQAGFTNVTMATRLGPGDLLSIKPSGRYAGTAFKMATALYPRWLVRLFGDGMGLYLLLEGRKPVA